MAAFHDPFQPVPVPRPGQQDGADADLRQAGSRGCGWPLAKHHRIEAEVFAVALDARGQIAKVTAGRTIVIRG